MSESLTPENVERFIAQLSPADRRRLAARLASDDEEAKRQDYFRRMETFLRMVEECPIDLGCESDSAADIRELREERISRF